MNIQKNNKLDFTNQDIYVGIDVHKKSWTVSIHLKEFEHKTFTQPSDVKILVNYLRRNIPNGNYYSVYEAGCFVMLILKSDKRMIKLRGKKGVKSHAGKEALYT
jgi:hypothetical protein